MMGVDEHAHERQVTGRRYIVHDACHEEAVIGHLVGEIDYR